MSIFGKKQVKEEIKEEVPMTLAEQYKNLTDANSPEVQRRFAEMAEFDRQIADLEAQYHKAQMQRGFTVMSDTQKAVLKMQQDKLNYKRQWDREVQALRDALENRNGPIIQSFEQEMIEARRKANDSVRRRKVGSVNEGGLDPIERERTKKIRVETNERFVSDLIVYSYDAVKKVREMIHGEPEELHAEIKRLRAELPDVTKYEEELVPVGQMPAPVIPPTPKSAQEIVEEQMLEGKYQKVKDIANMMGTEKKIKEAKEFYVKDAIDSLETIVDDIRPK